MTLELAIHSIGQLALVYKIKHQLSGQQADIEFKIHTDRLDRAIIAAEAKFVEFLIPEFFDEFVDIDSNDCSDSQFLDKHCHSRSCKFINAHLITELANKPTAAHLEILEGMVKEARTENTDLEFKYFLWEIFAVLKLIVHFAHSSLPIESSESNRRWKIEMSANRTPLASCEVEAPSKEVAHELTSLWVLLKVFPGFRKMIG